MDPSILECLHKSTLHTGQARACAAGGVQNIILPSTTVATQDENLLIFPASCIRGLLRLLLYHLLAVPAGKDPLTQ